MAMKRGESKKFKRWLSHLLADSTMTVKPDVEADCPICFLYFNHCNSNLVTSFPCRLVTDTAQYVEARRWLWRFWHKPKSFGCKCDMDAHFQCMRIQSTV